MIGNCFKKKTARPTKERAEREMDQLGSTGVALIDNLEQVRPHQPQGLESSLGDALALPLADRRLLDVEKTGHCGRSTQFIDELFAVHGRSIGAPIVLSIGSPIFLLGRLA